jgi:glc operon protein GlcG
MSDIRSVPTVSYAAAGRVVAAASERAAAEGIAVCIAVTDPGGNLVAFGRMDGAPLLSAKIAEDKAYTVSAFNGVPTADWYGMIRDNPPLLTGIVHRDRLVVFGGGVPLTVDGQLVGAVGVSGGSAEQDELCAAAGAKALSAN